MSTIRTPEQIDETSRRGMKFYNEQIKPLLSAEDNGRFIAIDSNTGEYEIGENEDVGLILKDRHPEADIFLLVHPRIWVNSFGGGMRSVAEK